DGAVPEQALHDLGRQLAPTVRLPIDAPRRKEMAEGMESVFGASALIHHASGKQHGCQRVKHAPVVHEIAPVPVGNTRSSSPFGQASLHTLSAATTSGGSGTARVLDADLGAPMTL